MSESVAAPAGEDPAVPAWARRTLYGFLAVFMACGLVSIEIWPLTGWRLYHERRGQERSSWQIVTVDPDGDETTVHLDELPLGWHNTSRLIGGFAALSPAERDGICAAWAQPAVAAGEPVLEVRVYRVRSTLRAESSDRRRELAWTCGRS